MRGVRAAVRAAVRSGVRGEPRSRREAASLGCRVRRIYGVAQRVGDATARSGRRARAQCVVV